MGRLDRALGMLDRLVEVCCHLMLIAILAVTGLQVMLRFVFNAPTSWSEEIALLLLVWYGLLAVALAVRRHWHIAITVVRDALPPVMGRGLDVAAQVGALAFAVLLVHGGIQLVNITGVQVLPASGLPKAWLYAPAVLGGALMMLNAFGNLATGRTHATTGPLPPS